GKRSCLLRVRLYEALKEHEDIDVEPTAELGKIKIRRYHFKDEKFTRSVHSGRFDPDSSYKFSIIMLGGDCSFGTPRSMTRPPRLVRNSLISKQEFVVDSYEPTMRVTCKFRKGVTKLETS
ncbi:hypothetical protein PIB30_080837, partial [Stylosanthes scabra]|nr:hypothetical protein [Stylosanthes scabra]